MTIIVNGEALDVADGLTIEALLGQLKIRREYTAVALNREITRKSAYTEIVLREGDRVEIVRPMGGGQ